MRGGRRRVTGERGQGREEGFHRGVHREIKCP